ncbi:RagB/SusD family nutrient uptake outer membrane protein [Chitinophaga sp. sic0106]|uniref:RagB/SusD family nutrient uptake outer membrane protein n=1 Tax=Chitinophaga sp. sic0106 TaxID=2854785 RepID=UPI001C497A3D|nr:RagB/SusD family nutrient uptake outer membrane protein [Chitinophaga sp. sic0106]MBV7532356.1 RagB/SusD family nutrient uptake outer membrane protein [Chitinophaga sp. sic0106]
MNQYIKYCLIGTLAIATSCSKNFSDPSGPSSDQAYSTPAAIADVAVGLQAYYVKDRTGLLYNSVTAGSILTGETFVTNTGNVDEAQLQTGGVAVLNTNSVINQLWATSNKIIYESNRILTTTPKVITDPGFASGVIAYASLYKAWAIGTQAAFFEQVPDTSGFPGANTAPVAFISGQAGYRKAVGVLDNAINTITATPIGSNFTPYVPAGVNVLNSLYALKARYALCAGDYDVALAAADKASLTVKSTLNFNDQVNNPIFFLVASTSNIYQATDSTMGLPVGFRPENADQRLPFYLLRNPTSSLKWGIKGFWTSTTAQIPVYLPGEMTLIKAECYARKSDVTNGLIELNKVVTKQPAGDIYGVGAGLPAITSVASPAALLDSIYKHRRIELYLAGQELEDSRRFGRPASERKRTYFPYPLVERNDNPNTPADPAQ